jgi:intracellular sulfur oxidation DsrE/DsrF family protein
MFPSMAQTPSNIIIPDYGTIWDIQDVVKPDTNLEYQIVIDLKTPVFDPDEVNRGLDNVARMLNLHAAGGIPSDQIKVIVAIHGGATSIVMNDEGYKRKHGSPNPNIDLINQLKEAGVELFVCGQSLIARNYPMNQVNDDIEIALSMLTVVTESMRNGYDLLVFQ